MTTHRIEMVVMYTPIIYTLLFALFVVFFILN